MEGISDFYRLDKFRNKNIVFYFEELKEFWERGCDDGDDIYDSLKTKITENHIFDNVYLSKNENKLAFISVIEDNRKLFIPFSYSYTAYLKLRNTRTDISRRIERILVNNIDIIVPQKEVKIYIDSLNWKEDPRYPEFMINKERKFLDSLENFDEEESKLYKMFES